MGVVNQGQWQTEQVMRSAVPDMTLQPKVARRSRANPNQEGPEELPNGGFRPLREMFEGTISHPRESVRATKRRGRGDIQGIGVEVEPNYGPIAEHFGL